VDIVNFDLYILSTVKNQQPENYGSERKEGIKPTAAEKASISDLIQRKKGSTFFGGKKWDSSQDSRRGGRTDITSKRFQGGE